MNIYQTIPYEIRKEDETHLTIEDVEKALKDSFFSSHVSTPQIMSVYIDNKYTPLRIEVNTYKNTVPLENNISVPYKDYKDEQGEYIEIIVIYIETKEEYNLVKHTCKGLGITYNQLGLFIGYGENSISNASRGDVSKAMKKAIELYTETLKLKKELENSDKIKATLKEWLK